MRNVWEKCDSLITCPLSLTINTKFRICFYNNLPAISYSSHVKSQRQVLISTKTNAYTTVHRSPGQWCNWSFYYQRPWSGALPLARILALKDFAHIWTYIIRLSETIWLQVHLRILLFHGSDIPYMLHYLERFCLDCNITS